MARTNRTLLIVTRHTPLPEEDGAGAYLSDLARYLAAAGWRVHLAWTEPHTRIAWAGLWLQPESLNSLTILHLPGALRFGPWHFFPNTYWAPLKARTLHTIKTVAQTLRLWPTRYPTARAIRSATPSVSRSWERLAEAHELAFADQVAAGICPAVTIANYPWMTPIFELPHLRASLPVCLAHDVAWKRLVHLNASRPPHPDDITREKEAALLTRARVIVAISTEDAREFTAMAPKTRVVVAPKSASVVESPLASSSSHLLFVGSQNTFNAEGLMWFLGEVWPLILRARPELTLAVCGSIDQAVAVRPAGVTFHGRVPTLATHYAAAALVIAPLRRATGLNIKLVEALAHGKPCLTTEVTLGGAPFLRAAVVIANEAETFASEAVRLLADPAARQALSECARVATRQYFSPAACYDPLVAAIDTEISAISQSAPAPDS
jgi:glycosyltransferase involved in cell wall biosynthesis